MKELINYLDTNKDIVISNQTNDSITLKWMWDGAGFHLGIYRMRANKYRCSGKTYVKDYCKGETVESTVWRIVDSEREMIEILDKLINSLTGMQKYLIGKRVYGD